MKRWQKVSIWIVSIVIVLVVGGIFAANYAVDKVLNSMVGMSVDDLLGEENSDASSNVSPDTASPSNSGESKNSGGSTSTDGSEGNVNSGGANSSNGDSTTSNSGDQA